MSDRNTGSDLLEIAKRNGDFRKNYGTIIGGNLHLRSIKCGWWSIRFLAWPIFHGGKRWFRLAAETWLFFSQLDGLVVTGALSAFLLLPDIQWRRFALRS